MKRIRLSSVALISFFIVAASFVGFGDTSKAPGAEQTVVGPADAGYVKMRDETKALYLIQSLLDWYARTQGERSIYSETYKGHEQLFSKESIAYIDGLLKNPALSEDDRRAISYLKNTFILEYVAKDTAHFDDDINNAEAGATVKIDWIEGATPYRELDGLLSNENDPDKRKTLQAAQAQVWKDVLNPIHARQEARVQQLAVELGYPSYVTLSENFRSVDLKKLIRMSQTYIASTDAEYRKIFGDEVQEVMGFPAEKFTRADIPYFASVPKFKPFFPAALTIPTFEYFLGGMGLDLTTAARTQIVIDDTPREKKEPRAACYQMTVPDDIRITVKPTGGIPDFETFFHESGHAMHFGNTTVPQWEFQQLGNNAITEGFAIFFENVWGNYEWLLRYRELVNNYNSFQPIDKKIALMTDADMGKLIRNRAFWNMYMVRRYSGAKLIYESILHGGDASYYKDFYKGQTQDLQTVYKDLFSFAYGFQLTDENALRYRTDVDSFFYSADYSRAFLLSAQLEEAMRAKFGERWFEDPKAGVWLKELWSYGSKLQPDELARKIGFPEVNYDQFAARNEHQLELARKLTTGK
jgi:hypothetical protein